jgi:hypothetical protein
MMRNCKTPKVIEDIFEDYVVIHIGIKYPSPHSSTV